MRKAVTWLAGAVGLAALARLRSRRRAAAVEPAGSGRGRPRRGAPPQARRPAQDETVDAEPDSSAGPVDLEARRAQVHARAQEAIDVMRDGESEPGGSDGDSVA